jgi:hypothetical protein
VDDAVVNAVLDIRSPDGRAEDSGLVGFVIGEQQRDAALAIEVVDQRFLEQRVRMVRLHHATFSSLRRLDIGFEPPSGQD